MLKINRKWIMRLHAAMLIPLLCCLTSCGGRQVKVIRSDMMIQRLPSGNWEVTDAWLKDTYDNMRYWQEQAEKK